MKDVVLTKDCNIYLRATETATDMRSSTIILTLKKGSVGVFSNKMIFNYYTFKVSDTLEITIPERYEMGQVENDQHS